MHLLLVEDNEDDIELTKEAIEEVQALSGFGIELHIVRNGLEALSYLNAGGRCHLVLLDINMPRMNGIELLQTLKQPHSQLRRIPVCMLTTSDVDRDIWAAYDNYCAGYVAKPVRYESFVVIVQNLVNYWFDAVTLPREESE